MRALTKMHAAARVQREEMQRKVAALEAAWPHGLPVRLWGSHTSVCVFGCWWGEAGLRVSA